MISVVVPAHNEQAVIERSLRVLAEAAGRCDLEILVVCNGCTDATAERARSVAGPITVVEIEEASKIAALNAADEMLDIFPRVYVDADVELDARSLVGLVRALESGACDLALARGVYLVEGSGPVVRSYLRFWAMLPQVTSVAAGSGVYALSSRGRVRFDRWPDITNDDAYVRAVLGDASRIVSDSWTTVRAPQTLRSLVRRKARVVHGNRQLEARGRSGTAHPWLAWIRVLRERPRMLAHLPAYVYVTLLSRLLTVAGREPDWGHDGTSRSLAVR